MLRHRPVSRTFEENIAAEKAKLEAQLADLRPGPEMDALRKKLRQLDDRFHETGIDGTGSLLVDSSFETERGVVSWQDGVRRSSWR